MSHFVYNRLKLLCWRKEKTRRYGVFVQLKQHDCSILPFSDVYAVFSVSESEGLKPGFMVQYLPIEGLAAFNKATAELLFGADNPVIKEGRVSTM
jgi:hypothetical protein